MPKLTRSEASNTKAVLLQNKGERNQLNLLNPSQLFDVGFISKHTST